MSDPNKGILENLRQILAGGRGKTGFLYELDNSLLWQVYSRLKNGNSANSIAKFLHDKNAAAGDSIESTSKQLLRFKKRIAHLLVSPVISLKNPPLIPFVPQVMQDGDLSKIEELQQRYAGVIDRMLDIAEADPMAANPHLAKHIQAYAQLEKTSLKTRTEQRKNPDTHNYNSKTTKGRFEAFLKGTPDDGRSLIIAAEKLLETIDEGVLVLQVDDEGNYSTRPINEAERIQDYSFGICGGIASRSINSEEDAEKDDADPNTIPDE